MKEEKTNDSRFTPVLITILAIVASCVVFVTATGIACGSFFAGIYYQKHRPVAEKLFLDENKHTVTDFSEVVVEAAKQQALLVVDEQEMSVTSTITQEGFFEWELMKKTQMVTYYGTAQYTVDLSQLSSENIVYDEAKNVLVIYVPKTQMHAVVFDPGKTVVGDVEKGILAFGDIKLSQEQTQAVEEEAMTMLTEAAKESECMDKADKYALYVLREIFEATVEQVDETTKVEIRYIEE